MELDLGNSVFLDELDEDLLKGLLESVADSTGCHNDAHSVDVFEAELKNRVSDGHGKPTNPPEEKAHMIHASSSSSSSSSPLSVPHENDEKLDGDLIDLASIFRDYEVDELEKVQHDGTRTSMDSAVRGETMLTEQAEGRLSSSSYTQNQKRAGETLEDEKPSSKRQQRKDDRLEDKESDSKRQQRLVRNRNSAALSRWRKRAGMEALEKRNSELERANARLNYLLASASMENQALRAALVDRDGVDTVNGQGMSAVGEPAVLSQRTSQPMYAEQLKTHNSLQLEYQQFPCATASHLRRPVRYAALLLLSLFHHQCCRFPGWSLDGSDFVSLGQGARVEGGGLSLRGESMQAARLVKTSRALGRRRRAIGGRRSSGSRRSGIRKRKHAHTKQQWQ